MLRNKIITFDIETNQLQAVGGKIVSLQVGYKKCNIYVDLLDKNKFDKIKQAICKRFVDPRYKIVMHNAIFEWEWIYVNFGVEITNFEDTMLLAFALDAGVPFVYTGVSTVDNPRKLKSVGLKKLVAHHFGETTEENDFFKESGTKKYPGIIRAIDVIFFNKNFKDTYLGKSPILKKYNITNRRELYELFKSYAVKDVKFTYMLWEILAPSADFKSYKNMLRAIPYMVKMKLRGIMLDIDYLREQYTAELMLINNLEKQIYELAGEEFNIASPEELPAILQKIGLELPKTEKGNYSTKKEVLQQLNDPLVEKILQYRKLTKHSGTYLKNILKDADENGVVRPTYMMCGTVHGRYSSKEAVEAL